MGCRCVHPAIWTPEETLTVAGRVAEVETQIETAGALAWVLFLRCKRLLQASISSALRAWALPSSASVSGCGS